MIITLHFAFCAKNNSSIAISFFMKANNSFFYSAYFNYYKMYNHIYFNGWELCFNKILLDSNNIRRILYETNNFTPISSFFKRFSLKKGASECIVYNIYSVYFLFTFYWINDYYLSDVTLVIKGYTVQKD